MSIPTLSSTRTASRGPVSAGAGAPVLDVVIPVYNEERDLGTCVRRLHVYLTEHLPYPFRLTIADNASIDATQHVANALAAELDGTVVVRLKEKGRGRA